MASTDVGATAWARSGRTIPPIRRLGLVAICSAGHTTVICGLAPGCDRFEFAECSSRRPGRFIVERQTPPARNSHHAAVMHPQARRERHRQHRRVMLANHNAPLQASSPGPRPVQSVAAKAASVEVEVTELPVAAAFHSSLVRPAQQPCRAHRSDSVVGNVGPGYSNTTGRAHSAEPLDVKRQWRRISCSPSSRAKSKPCTPMAPGFRRNRPQTRVARLVSRISTGDPRRRRR